MILDYLNKSESKLSYILFNSFTSVILHKRAKINSLALITYSLTHSFIHSFIHPFIHSFIVLDVLLLIRFDSIVLFHVVVAVGNG